MFQGESEGETKKPERYVIYEALSRSSRFSFTIHPQGRLILQELCHVGLHWGKQASEEYVKSGKLEKESYIT